MTDIQRYSGWLTKVSFYMTISNLRMQLLGDLVISHHISYTTASSKKAQYCMAANIGVIYEYYQPRSKAWVALYSHSNNKLVPCFPRVFYVIFFQYPRHANFNKINLVKKKVSQKLEVPHHQI